MATSRLHQILDVHTHRRGVPFSIYSASPAEARAIHQRRGDDQAFSIALHPAEASAEATEAFLLAVAACHGDPRFRAIGECGLDRLSPASEAAQREAFLTALRVARQEQMPTVVHCVGRWKEVNDCVVDVWGADGAHAAAEAGCPIILHGFVKKPALARQMLGWGFAISLGPVFNPRTPRVVPSDRLYYETDETVHDINDVRRMVALARQPL